MEVDLTRRIVRKGDAPVHLTPIEYRLLTLLITNAGRVLTHRQILREVWGPATSSTSTTCASTWGICGRSSKMIRRSRGTWSPKRPWAIGW